MKLGLFSFESNQNKEEMVWNYPEISKEDFIKLLKGFVDLLILASGFQSSGVPAHWDAENCKKALQWGLFFENVGFFSLSLTFIPVSSPKLLVFSITRS